MDSDILWTSKRIDTAKRNLRGMIMRMKEDGKVSPFVVYTPRYRLFWLPENTAIGCTNEKGDRNAMFFESDTLGFVENVSKSGEFEVSAISPAPAGEKELLEAIFSFLKNKCGMNPLDVRRSCMTADRLDPQPVEATESDDAFEDGMGGSCGPAD